MDSNHDSSQDIGSRLRVELKKLLGSTQFQSVKDIDMMTDILMKKLAELAEEQDSEAASHSTPTHGNIQSEVQESENSPEPTVYPEMHLCTEPVILNHVTIEESNSNEESYRNTHSSQNSYQNGEDQSNSLGSRDYSGEYLPCQ